MKILVAIKGVPDLKTTIRVKADGLSIDTANAKVVMNPFDEIAVEEAVRLKEQGKAKEILVVSIGNSSLQEVLRAALAMGADKALLLQTEAEIQPLAAAKLLADLASKEKPGLIILGKQAVDTDNNQVGQMLAGLLKWPQATFASKVVLEEQQVEVTREIDGGLETLVLQLPAVVTTDLRLNEPRYLSLPNIVQAKRKPLEILPLAAEIDIKPRLKLLKLSVPQKQRASVRVESSKELLRLLKEEAKVIS